MPLDPDWTGTWSPTATFGWLEAAGEIVRRRQAGRKEASPDDGRAGQRQPRLGFALAIALRPGADGDAFLLRLVDVAERAGLHVGGGGGNRRFAGFVSGEDVTDGDRTAFARMLSGDPDVAAHEVGPLVDADGGP